MENRNENKPVTPVTPPPYTPYPPYVPTPPAPPFQTSGKELFFAIAALVCGMLLCNFVLFGGFNLGFAIGVDLCIVACAVYLLVSGHKPTAYSTLLLLVSLVIGAGFARSDDAFVKFVMVCFLFVSVNLGLTLLAGRQRYSESGFMTLGDVFCTGFAHSFSGLSPAARGVKESLASRGEGYRKGSAIFKGLVIAIPVVFIMLLLLVRADAAFEGLVGLLPEFELGELIATVLFGFCAGCLLYAQSTSLQHSEQKPPVKKERKGVSPLTVNTVLIAVCLLYLVYLFSQLAYFVGGFAGILPGGFTLAQYARRGFFEMAWLCAINLGLIGLCIGLVEKQDSAPLLTKLACLFISLITVFFVATASGKMFLYIGAYGLTRLRVLTQVIMLWLCLTNIMVAVWLFVPKLPYMKIAVCAALIIGAVVLWVDVDNLVAGYNVSCYLNGSMTEIDVAYLSTLNLCAIPHIGRLAQNATDPAVQQRALHVLKDMHSYEFSDFREWNYAQEVAIAWLKLFQPR